MTTWGHDELAHDLATHLRGNVGRRLVWEDMQLGPAGSRRPDVFAMSTSFTRFVPLAYECKVTRSDFRHDVSSGKWQEYLKFASGVIFAVPHGLIKKEELPDHAGLIVRSERAWRTAKSPKIQVLQSLPHGAWMKLLMDGVGRLRIPIEPRDASRWRFAGQARKLLGDEVSKAMSDRDNALWCLEDEKKRADQRRSAVKKRLAETLARMEAEVPEANELLGELAEAVGLDRSAHISRVRNRVAEIARGLTDTDEYRTMLGAVSRAESSVYNAKQALEIAHTTLAQKLMGGTK